jgi:hypothetical protein
MADEKAKKSVSLVGEGGSPIEFDLPLAAVYIEQVNKGTLVPADEKAAKALADAGVLTGGAAGVDRLKAIEAREEAIAAKEAELAERERALEAAAADADVPVPDSSGSDGKEPGASAPQAPTPTPDDKTSGKPAPKGKGA